MAVLGFPLGLVGRSEFGHLWSGLSGAGSVPLLPAADQFIFPVLLSFSLASPVAEVRCVVQPDPQRYQAPGKQVTVSGNRETVE